MSRTTRKKILHITPHFGGGVGSTVLNYLSEASGSGFFEHKAVCLDYANQYAKEIAKNAGFELLDDMSNKKPELLSLIDDADVVLIHWWNHPLLYDFLVREKLPKSRVIVWSLITGSLPPNNFTDKIFKYPDIFVFSTPLSYNVKDVQSLSDEQKKILRVVWATGTIDRVSGLKLKKHDGFNIGYIGTVDYAKMHPDFLSICSKVNIPNVNFIVVGGPNESQPKREAKDSGLEKKFNFTGFVQEEKKWEYLSLFDVFGYPLAPHHYGSCDLALQEAMAAGVVPVVLNNPMESYIVKDGVTGVVVKDKDEYVRALQDLYHNPERKNFLSKNAIKYAMETFSLKRMINDWDKIFNEALAFPKTVKKWEISTDNSKITAKDIFLESLGSYGKDFVSYCNAKTANEKRDAVKKIEKLSQSINWQSETKSTVHHYKSFFPDDKYLSFWSQLMRDAIKK